jgi:acyl carrier protein
VRPEDIEKVVLELIMSVVPRRFKAHARAGLRPEMERQADLGIDSLALTSLLFRLEEKCSLRFNQDDLAAVGQLRTVGDIVRATVHLVTNAQQRQQEPA